MISNIFIGIIIGVFIIIAFMVYSYKVIFNNLIVTYWVSCNLKSTSIQMVYEDQNWFSKLVLNLIKVKLEEDGINSTLINSDKHKILILSQFDFADIRSFSEKIKSIVNLPTQISFVVCFDDYTSDINFFNDLKSKISEEMKLIFSHNKLLMYDRDDNYLGKRINRFYLFTHHQLPVIENKREFEIQRKSKSVYII